MSLTQSITNGIVSIEDGHKAAEEYAPARKVRVELHFDTNEADPQAIIDHVCAIAAQKVNDLLGRASTIALVDAAAATGKPKSTKAKTEPKPTEAPKDTVDNDDLGLGETKAAAASSDDLGLEDVKTAEENLDDIFGGEPAKEITDAELNSEVQKKHTEVQNPKAIRELISKHAAAKIAASPAGYVAQLRDIDQAERQPFLDAIRALKKA